MKRNNIRKQYGKLLAHEQLLLVMSAPYQLFCFACLISYFELGGEKKKEQSGQKALIVSYRLYSQIYFTYFSFLYRRGVVKLYDHIQFLVLAKIK